MRNIILYLSSKLVRVIKSRILRWADHVARMEEDRSVFRIFTEKPTRSRHLESPRHILNVNIRMDIKETRNNTRNWGFIRLGINKITIGTFVLH